MFSRTRRRNRQRRGAVIVLVMIALVAVLTCVAITYDGGNLLEERRHAQATADAGALAAAEVMFREYPTYHGYDSAGTAEQAAEIIARLNGFDPDDSSATVTIRTAGEAYTGGPNKGSILPEGHVEVTVERQQLTFFGGIVGSERLPVKARAVAMGKWAPSNIGIHVLDLHAEAALTATGESSLTVNGASIIVNSDDIDAAATTTGGTITAEEINVTGGTSISGNSGGFVGDLHHGTPPEPDPLRHLPEPDINSLSVQRNGPLHIANGQRTLQPGIYSGGISVSGQGSLTLEPGIYYMDGGGFSFAGQGDLVAEGVMIFNAPTLSSHKIDISGTGSVVMSPPTDGIYKGLTLFQDRESLNSMSVSGGGYMDIKGTFYTANGTLQVSGGGDSKVGSQYISRFLNIVGNGGMVIDYDAENAIPRRVLNLVE